MNVKLGWITVLSLLIGLATLPAQAQGYGGLGTEAEGFDVPSRQYRFSFPDDHGSHPGFRIEWWYLTANLRGEDGRDYGAQWTLFRSAIAPPAKDTGRQKTNWTTNQLWMGHAAVTTPKNHYVSETRSRGVMGIAGVETEPFKAWINDWQLASNGPFLGDTENVNSLPGSGGEQAIDHLTVSASGKDFAYNLQLDANGPLVFHGDRGYSVKSSTGQASHYYSQPHYQVSGQLELPGGSVKVSGTAWLDREWSSQPLASDQSGWDWVSLNLDDGSKLMGFRLRGAESGGKSDDSNVYTSASWISPEGKTTAFANGKLSMTALSRSQVAGRELPTRWRVQLPDQNIDLEIEALNEKAWMKTSFPYWEGPVIIRGSHTGRGYLEMTGYQ